MGYCVKNKVAIVTGSAKGFGKEFAVRLLKNGAKVCLSDVDEHIGDETRKELQLKYGTDRVTFHRYVIHCNSFAMILYDYILNHHKYIYDI